MPTLNELKSQHDEMIQKMEDLGTKAASETGLTDDDRVTLAETVDEAKQLKARIEQAKSDQEAIDAVKSMFGGLLPAEVDPAERQERAKSIGRQFIESDAYKSAIATGSPTRVDAVPVQGLMKSLLRAGNDAAGGALVSHTSARLGIVDSNVFAPRVFRDLVDVQTSDSQLIEFIRTTFTNNAAETAEATATSGSSGTKPESGHTFEADSVSAVTIAHWEPVTKKMLNNQAQLMGIMEGDLLEGLEDRLEGEILNGNGSGANLTGILNTSGIQTQAFVTDLFTTILKAKTAARINGRVTPTAVALSPVGMETVLLAKESGTGAFLYGGPGRVGPVTIWGLPAIESEEVADDEAIVADWKKAKLYDVEAATIAWTESHSDFFVRNISVCRAEMDVALAIFRPAAFVQATIADGGS